METKKRTVCPTYVGMNRATACVELTFSSMPHVCGDEPQAMFSILWSRAVCPTYVGMNR